MVNYIKHLQSTFETFAEDERLSPWHISLYYALFHSWNAAKFQNPISINRAEMMQYSKIGSVNTYSKCLKQLDQWGYIEYAPSKSALRGSKVHMFIFDTTADTTPNASGEPQVRQPVRPSINSLNKKKQLKPLKQMKERNQDFEETTKKSKFQPPDLDQVKSFFLEIQSNEDQAEQFFNHFESNGWLVGGKSKMKNWEAAGKNWIKRSRKFSNDSSLRHSKGTEMRSSSSVEMNAPNNSNYNIPL